MKAGTDKKKSCHRLTNCLRQDLQVGHSVVLEQLDAVDAVKTVVLHHEKGGIHTQPVEYRSFPFVLVPPLPPVVLNANSHNVVRIWGQCVTQLPTASLPDNEYKYNTKSQDSHFSLLEEGVSSTLCLRTTVFLL